MRRRPSGRLIPLYQFEIGQSVEKITVIVCKQTDDPTDNVEIVKPVRQLRNYDFQFGHSTDLDKLLQSLMIFENSKLGFI